MATGAAKVILQEWDLSQRVPSYPGVYGAIVLPAKKGKVNAPYLVTSETDFLQRFTPDETIKVGYDLSHYDALQFLSKSNALWVVRAATGATYGGAYLAQDSVVDSIDCTINLGESALVLKQVTATDVKKAKMTWDSLTNGDCVMLKTSGILPSPLSPTSKYYIIKYRSDKGYLIQLATSLDKAYNNEFINLQNAGSGTVTMVIAESTTMNNEIEFGMTEPDAYQLNSSDGRIVGLTSTFALDFNYSALNVSKSFWNTCGTGDKCKLTTNSTFPEISGGAPLDEDTIYYIIKIEADETGIFKIQIANSYENAISGTEIEFASLGEISVHLSDKSTISTVAVVNPSNHTILIDTKFHNTMYNGAPIRLLVEDGELPGVLEGDPLSSDVDYYVLKGDNNLIQISREFGGEAIAFSDGGTGTLSIISNELVTDFDTEIDVSDDVLSVNSTFYENMSGDSFAVTVESTGTLPKGLKPFTKYYAFADPSGAPNKIKLAANAGNAKAGIAIDITDTGDGMHTITSANNYELGGVNRKCMLIYTSTPTEEELYIETLHYPYGDESTWSDEDRAAAIKVGTEGCFLLTILKKNNAGEFYEVESWTMSREPGKLDGYGTNTYCEQVIEGSKYIRIVDNTSVPSMILPKNQTSILKLANGSSGGTVTDNVMMMALDKLKSKRNYSVTIIMDGGWTTPAYAKSIITLCETRQDCVGLLTTPISCELSSDYLEQIKNYRNYTLNANTSYAALYTPHLKIADKFNDREIYVSPSAFVAGIISRNEANYEIWYAPAGPRYGILSEPLDVSRRFNEGDLDELYNNGINPVDFYPGRGIRVWGQKTLQAMASALDRLNVRLLLIYIEPAIMEFLEGYLFEINDEMTRNSIKLGIESYMSSIKSRRGVYDYKVVCSSENNTPEDIDANLLNVWLFIQPTKTIEWIKFRVILTRTGASMSL